MAKVTISEALSWKKTLDLRHAELVSMRDQNSARNTRYYGTAGDNPVTKDPTYDVKKLDKLVTQIAREIRKVDNAIKKANAKLSVPDYDQDDAILGEVE